MSKEAFKILFSFGVPPWFWWVAALVLVVASIVVVCRLGWRRRTLDWIMLTLAGEYVVYILSATVFLRTVGENRLLVLFDFSKYVRLFVDNDCEAFYDTWMNVALYVPLGLLLMICRRRFGRAVSRGRAYGQVILLGLALSCTVEVLQYVFGTRRKSGWRGKDYA